MNIPKKINVVGYTFNIKVDSDSYDASFSFDDKIIIIGTATKDKEVILDHLIHEISELIHVILNNRLYKSSNDSYIFLYEHSNFQTHNEILVSTLVSNKIIKSLI